MLTLKKKSSPLYMDVYDLQEYHIPEKKKKSFF